MSFVIITKIIASVNCDGVNREALVIRMTVTAVILDLTEADPGFFDMGGFRVFPKMLSRLKETFWK